MTSRFDGVAPNAWHKCGCRACQRKIRAHYFACSLHRRILGFALNARMHTAWLYRKEHPQDFKDIRAEADAAWAAPQVSR